MSNTNNNWAQRHRQLRLFISSTFLDMNAERDALTRIFPQIADLCQRRGVEFVPLDLRWGITEAAAKEGRVVETCLREIDDARPFFIGIIGNRYGWAPSENDLGQMAPELKSRYPWIETAINEHMSITEMEMQYAALMGHADQNMNACFYIRSDKMQVDNSFKEAAGSSAEAKLNALKNKIAQQKRFKSASYDSVDHLASMVLRDVTAFLDKVYPAIEISTYDEQARKQEEILLGRSNNLIPLGRYNDRIQSWIMGKTKRNMIITGYPGRGKSYLLAAWVNALRKSGRKVVYADYSEIDTLDNAGIFICQELLNLMGVKTRKRSERESMLGCFFGLLWSILKISFAAVASQYEAILKGSDAASKSFSDKYNSTVQSMMNREMGDNMKSLEKAFKKRPQTEIYVAIDNLDSMGDEELAMLDYFCSFKQIKLIATSSLKTKAQMFLTNADHVDTLQMENLDMHQASSYVRNFLAQYGKSLDPEGKQCARLLGSGIAGSVQLLTNVLNLMVRFGSYEKIDSYITQLSEVKSENQMCSIMLDNIFSQFKAGEELGLVQDIIMALAVVEKGLTESEITDIFKPKPIEWALMRPYILSICKIKDKLISISSQACRSAVFEKLIERSKNIEYRISGYFEGMLVGMVEHKMGIGTVDGFKISEDAKKLDRQVQVLPQLYYELADVRMLYLWVTYVFADMRLSQEQRVRYWKALYDKGFSMRSSGDVDIAPFVKRMRQTSPSVARSLSGKDPWLVSTQVQKNEMYARWNLIAGLYAASDDIAWLADKLVQTTDAQSKEVARKVAVYQKMLSDKKFDEIIAYNKTDNLGDFERVIIDIFVLIAYKSKGDDAKAFEVSRKNINDILRLKLESLPDILVNICYFAELSYNHGSDLDVDMALRLLNLHKGDALANGLSNMNTNLMLFALSLVHLRKRNYEQTVKYANMYSQSLATLGMPTTAAKAILEQAEKLKS